MYFRHICPIVSLLHFWQIIMTVTSSRTALTFAALVLALILIYTGISAKDKLTWLMEVTPVIIIVPLLLATHSRYPLTPLLYVLIFFHAIILMVGGMYTYAKVPIGFDVQAWLGLSRNPYDKLGHFFQGLVPALAAREILLRDGYVHGRKMLAFVVCCIALAISAVYELIEWWSALALGQGADDFLGTQGDPWDTQSDMFCALLGALTTVFALSRWHTKQLVNIQRP
ncbi:Inner membrane protein yjdF [Cronobacter sakazakii]|nr:inner membrane protein yjdF [Cronobacter sakazakii]CCK13478.1 Inner membrane protein yjdF [Cronobacter sakazakii 680]SPW23431.1 Inner membrane protein yjdF [Cronobacter sakazakii]